MGKERIAWKYKNRGNEAKKYLKTREVTFLNAADYACFERIFAQIGAQGEQKQAILRKTNRGLRVGNSDRQSASARLRFFAALKTCRGRACPTRSIRGRQAVPLQAGEGGEPFSWFPVARRPTGMRETAYSKLSPNPSTGFRNTWPRWPKKQ